MHSLNISLTPRFIHVISPTFIALRVDTVIIFSVACIDSEISYNMFVTVNISYMIVLRNLKEILF